MPEPLSETPLDAKLCPAVGIDLGTTQSALAYIDATGRPQTIANAEGDKLTPSAVFFDEDEVIVGKEALKALSSHAGDVAQCMKRELGRRFFDQQLGGRHYPPEALQAWVLSKLRRDASDLLGPIKQAVVTVPAYFDEVRRKATQDAGYIAGLDVIDIINEPTAAAIAYGHEQGFLSDSSAKSSPIRVLVYDLGGGTFDVTVMEIAGGEFVTLATDGDVRLGGLDWDRRLVDYVASEFESQCGRNPLDDPNARGRLWRDCEDIKKSLSARAKAKLMFDFESETIKIEITRAEFEERTRDLLERTTFTTRQTLQASGLQWEQIDRLLLVGGSTRMPAVSDALEQMSGIAPERSIAADEAVAFGAALHAERLTAMQDKSAPAFRLKNVSSHSLGVVASEPNSDRKRNAIVIPRNTALPVSAKRVFKTQKFDQSSVLVKIVEGESANADECIALGRCSVKNLPKDLPAQTPIEVRFRYQENGRLTIYVNVLGTDSWVQHEITRDNSLTQEQLRTWREFVAQSRNAQPPPVDGTSPSVSPTDGYSAAPSDTPPLPKQMDG